MSVQVSSRITTRQHTKSVRRKMGTAKVVFTIDQSVLMQLDRLVKRQVFPSRSKAIEEAVRDKLARINRTRLATECAKLDPRVEQAFAEEGMAVELATWPTY